MAATGCYTLPHVATVYCGLRQALQAATGFCTLLQHIESCYMLLHVAAVDCCRLLQAATGCYRLLQAATGGCGLLQAAEDCCRLMHSCRGLQSAEGSLVLWHGGARWRLKEKAPRTNKKTYVPNCRPRPLRNTT